MEWTRRRVVVISVVAAMLAITITSLASGVSLRKLVKKEVAKQISNATGPQGLQGVQGIQGQPGLVGPTFADVQGSLSPPAGPPEVGASTNSVTTPAAGPLLVFGSMHDMRVDCSAAVQVDVGLYVDDVAVPETNRNLFHMVAEPVDVFGVSASVAAGPHSVKLGATCAGAATVQTVVVSDDRSVGAVLVGS